MKFIRTATTFVSVFGGFGLAFGLTAAGNPIGGGLALVGFCLLGALIASIGR